MKIAITSDPFIPVPPVNYGGIERIIDFLAEGLAKKGHEIVLVAHADSKVNVPLIKYPRLKEGITGHINNVWTINKLKGWKPDLIHSFSRLAYLFPFLGSDVPKLMSYQREPTISQVKKTVKLSRKGTLAFTGCSNYISDQIKPFASSFTVYNGVDLEKYKFQSCVEDDAPLMYLGRIEPIKGTHIAIEAARITGRKLFIAGNIPTEYRAYFEEKVKPHLNERIEYIGPVNDIQKNELLGKAAAFLMPIEWNEPFGIVMAEALACGTPIIGYNRGAVPEIVEHGVNGFIADDFNSLRSYILKSETLSRVAARVTAEQNFSSKVIIERYLEVYQTLIKKN